MIIHGLPAAIVLAFASIAVASGDDAPAAATNRCGEYALTFASALLKPEVADSVHAMLKSGDARGVSLKELADAAHGLGFAVHGVKWNKTSEPTVPPRTVAIVALTHESGKSHFVAVSAVTDHRALVYDFPKPPRWVSVDELRAQWSGESLYLASDPASLVHLGSTASDSAYWLLASTVGMAFVVILAAASHRSGAPFGKFENRSGLALIELILVVAILGFLMALCLPAVLRARESARRITCANNLKQIAMAAQGYESSFGCFPGRWPGWLHLDERRVSVQATLLPYLDARSLSAQVDYAEDNREVFSEPPGSARNHKLIRTRVPVFACPSDSVPNGGLSYRGCTGTSPLLHSAPLRLASRSYPPGADLPLAGVFHQSACRAAEIRDGMSNTAFFSERVAGDQLLDTYTPWRDVLDLNVSSPEWLAFASPDEQASACRSAQAPPVTTGLSFAGATWLLASRYHAYYDHILGPNSAVPDCTTDVKPGVSDTGSAAIGARSLHAGGVHAALVDGAVRFVGQSIDLSVWRALGSINGRESLSDF